VNSFKLAKQARDAELNAAELELNDCETDKGNTETSLGDHKADLAQVTSDLKGNTDTLAKIEADFRSQSQAYNMRRSTQQGELEAMKQAVKIMSKVTHVDAPSFLQVVDPRTKAVQLLRETARATKSKALQRLAQQVSITDGPFDQINNMIQKMIFRLQSEQKDEDDHKNWCDLELEKTNTSKTHSQETIATLSGELDVLASKIADLTKTQNQKVSDIADYTNQMKELTDMRAEDKTENARVIKESQEAQNAVTNAIAVLEEFYKSSGAVQTDALLQAPVVLGENPGTWDSSYTGAANPKDPQAGILAILERVSADYSRVEADTQASETSGQNRFENEIKELKIQKAKAEEEVKQLGSRISRKQDAEKATKGKHEKRSSQLEAEEQYWNDLQKACVDGDSTYEDRKANRQTEITGLEDALKILKDAFKPKM